MQSLKKVNLLCDNNSLKYFELAIKMKNFETNYVLI